MIIAKFVLFSKHISFSIVSAQSHPKCPNIVSRDEWGARRGFEVTHLLKPVEYAIIHHTVTPECDTKSECIDRVYNTQVFHMEDLEYDDIGYK